jgi:hypothetical protein
VLVSGALQDHHRSERAGVLHSAPAPSEPLNHCEGAAVHSRPRKDLQHSWSGSIGQVEASKQRVLTEVTKTLQQRVLNEVGNTPQEVVHHHPTHLRIHRCFRPPSALYKSVLTRTIVQTGPSLRKNSFYVYNSLQYAASKSDGRSCLKVRLIKER